MYSPQITPLFPPRHTLSIAQAEEFVILRALQHVQKHHKDITAKSVVVFSDSRIALDSLKNKNNHSNLIEHIRHNLKLLTDDNWTIAFKRIKAHAGITGNEIADHLAKQAAKSHCTAKYLIVHYSQH